MKNLAIIPARGASKRIPKKNIRPLNGKPVIAYPIQAALDSGLFDEVMVSTDDDEIADVAKKSGAKIPFKRSAQNADDHATIADVLIEVVKEFQKQEKHFDNICCLLPTAALITAGSLTNSYDKFLGADFSSLVPVQRFAVPIQRALKEENGLLRLREPEHRNTRSQDLEPCYHDAAQFYWIKVSDLHTERSIFTEKTGFIELSEMEAQDVDSEADWEMLRLKFDRNHNRQ